jgi:hypothetical protein
MQVINILLMLPLYALMLSSEVQLKSGTYEVEICPQPCEVNREHDPDVKGFIVLFKDELKMSKFTQSEQEYLRDISKFLFEDDNVKPNACFVLKTLNENTKTLIGIIPVGITRYRRIGSIIEIPLFSSADSNDIAASVVMGNDQFKGTKDQAQAIGSYTEHLRTYMSGKRIGPPDIDLCRTAARAEMVDVEWDSSSAIIKRAVKSESTSVTITQDKLDIVKIIPPNGSVLDKTSIIEVDLNYQVTGFKPEQFRILTMLQTETLGEGFTFEIPAKVLKAASDMIHISIPINALWDENDLMHPVQIYFLLSHNPPPYVKPGTVVAKTEKVVFRE